MNKFNVIYTCKEMSINFIVDADIIENCISHFEARIYNEEKSYDIVAIIPINAIIINEKFTNIKSSRN